MKVSTNDILECLKVLISALKLTRQPDKFSLCTSDTIRKTFKWADMLKTLCSSADDIQLKHILLTIPHMYIGYIDENPSKLLHDPVVTAINVILTSPSLSYTRNASGIIIEVLNESEIRLGKASATELITSIFFNTVKFRNSMIRAFDAMTHELSVSTDDSMSDAAIFLQQQQRQQKYDLASYRIGADQICMSFELLFIVYQSYVLNNNAIDTNVVSKISHQANSDITTLQMICIALTLPLCTITHVLNISLYSNRTYQKRLSAFKHITYGACIATDLSISNDIYQLTFVDKLWDVLVACINTNVTRFLLIDDDVNGYALIRLMIVKHNAFYTYLLRGIASYITSSVSAIQITAATASHETSVMIHNIHLFDRMLRRLRDCATTCYHANSSSVLAIYSEIDAATRQFVSITQAGSVH